MKPQVVFLCTGNICRSPLAEVVAAEMFKDVGLRFASAGLEAVAGWPASTSSVEWAHTRELDLVGHRSQPVTGRMLAETAWFITMTRTQAAIFRNRYGADFNGAIGILGAPGFDLSSTRNSPELEEVDDPYGLSGDRYFACGDQILRLMAGWRETFAGLAEPEQMDE